MKKEPLILKIRMEISMKEWTREERYHLLDKNDEEQLKSMHREIQKSLWREDFHIQTVTGLMNDPNGFSYFNNKWHLFYQWFPYGPVHGMKHWYHVESDDLMHWKNDGVGILPNTLYENKGSFSGCGFVKEDTLYLVYTGNHRDENYVRHPFQLIAKMDKDGNITKNPEPIIYEQPGYTEHQRDPKLIYNDEDGYYYILLGAQRENKTGTFLLYKSKEIETGWKFHAEMKVEGFDDFGYMVECPDLEKIGNDWVLLFSPQGLEPKGDEFQNKFNNTYFVGSMDFEHAIFTPKDGILRELDRGFDFYAAQCAFQNVYPDTAILVGWFGCSDYSYPPTDEQNYEGLITLPRELTVDGAKLKQRSPRNFRALRGDNFIKSLTKPKAEDIIQTKMTRSAIYHIHNLDESHLRIQFWKGLKNQGLRIEYDPETKKLIMDKSSLFHQTNTDFGKTRQVYLENGLNMLDIYQDRSSVEVFINEGEYVMSVRVFPTEEENQLFIQGKVEMNVFDAVNTVRDDFVIWKE